VLIEAGADVNRQARITSLKEPTTAIIRPAASPR
jgi:hypothetical protein